MLTVVISAAALLLIAGACAWLARLIRTELTSLRSGTEDALTSRSADVDRRLVAVEQTLNTRLGALDSKVDTHLHAAAKTTSEIHGRLVAVDEATKQMLQKAQEIGKLEDILKPPKARGGFGELQLESLLRDRLPATAYEMQHTFASGDRVDAAIQIADRIVPVDSKFPLDNFRRLVDGATEADRARAQKDFVRDVKARIDEIATKYIREVEGTYNFALMYVPAEGVYYEVVGGPSAADLRTYASDRHVVPVSPTTLDAYLHVIALGLRGLQIEQHALEVMAYCAGLRTDFDRFRGDFDVLGTHLRNARTKFDEADSRLDKFDSRLEQTASFAPEPALVGEADEIALPPVGDTA